MPELGRITATVDVLPQPDSSVKVRAILWSGRDFRSPTIHSGAIFADAGDAHHAAERFITSCELLGIPVKVTGMPESDIAAAAILPDVSEMAEYQRR